MAILTGPRVTLVPSGTIKKGTFPLGIAALKAWDGAMACIDTANLGAVWPGKVSTTQKAVGTFLETKDNSLNVSTTIPIGVELYRERELHYWDSVTGAGAITIANLFQVVYIASDHEVTTVATGASIYGLVWTVNPQGAPGAVGVEALF
jgi:hypothetical protein